MLLQDCPNDSLCLPTSERHKIEAAWATAPDDERDGMLAQMNSLREQTVGMILSEINRLNSQIVAPAVPTATFTNKGLVLTAPAAPAAPVVFQ